MAFAVVQHLPPDFKSLMDEWLARLTDMAIQRVDDGIQVAANSIYLMPPKMEMTVEEDRWRLTDKNPSEGLSLPVNTFFASLAKSWGLQAVVVILSATGSDGSCGIRQVHESGEEAYLLAILLFEEREDQQLPLDVKILATDVHRASLDHASGGTYAEGQLMELSPKRRRRFFLRTARGYRLTPELRQIIVFAPLFSLLPQDVGRSFSSFSHSLERETLLADIRAVIHGEMHLEKEIRNKQRHWYVIRIQPYRSPGKLDGAVLELFDMTDVKTTHTPLRRAVDRLQAVPDQAVSSMCVKDIGAKISVYESAFYPDHRP